MADIFREVDEEVRRDRALEFWTKVVNIGAVPLIVTLVGVFLAISRRRRVVKL